MEIETTAQPEKTSDEVRRLRRIAKAERREKQRQASWDRAEKMRSARLEGAVAPPPVSTPARVSTPQRYHIGCSGWYYWHWKGTFYPEELPRADWFRHYAENFDTVELNAPFYSWPTLATVKTWIRQAEPSESFLYTVKVSELITHVERFEGVRELVLDFGYIADLLGPRFGCFLFQLPPSFTFTPARLESIVSALDPARRNVVEFRHRSWWNDEVFRAFREHGIVFCSCSGPRLPDEFVKTANDVYVRFHGMDRWYRHDYTTEELAVWADRIRESGARQAWIYFNNDFDRYAVKNAKELLLLLGDSA